MKLNLRNLYLIIPVFFGGMSLILHAYLGYFSRYIADDFCSAYFAHRLGILRAVWYWYLNWSGRYSASAADTIVSLLGPVGTSIVVAVTILIWLAVLIVFFEILLLQLKNRFLAAVALAIMSLFTLFVLAPNIRQSLYWGQGMRSVIPPLIMGTIQIILLWQLHSRQWTNPQLWLWYVVGFFWALVTGGFSETYASFQVVALIFAFGATLLIGKFHLTNTSRFLVTSLLGAVGAVIIIVLAPGNSARQAFFPEPPGIFGILAISLKSYSFYAIHLFDSLAKTTASFALFGLAAVIGSQLERKADLREFGIVPPMTLVFTFLCFPPAAYGLSDAPPPRTLILPTYFIVLGLVIFGLICGTLLKQKQQFAILKLLSGLAMFAVILSASITSNDLYRSRPEFIDYAMAWDQTDAQIRDARENAEAQIIIPVVPNWAELDTPNDNPKFWVNACMSSYYDIQILAGPNSDSQ